MCRLTDSLAARLTSRFGMRLAPEHAERIQAHRKKVGIMAGADELPPEVLERLLERPGIPCAWSYAEDDHGAYYSAFYVDGGSHHGDA